MSTARIDNPFGYKPIPKLLKQMAIPAIVGNLVNSLYNIVDQIFIGQGVGYLGNAATTIAFPLTTICLALGIMTGLGASSNFNLSLGEQKPEMARKYAANAVSMLFIAGVIIFLLVITNLKSLMIAFGASGEVLSYAMEYTGITSFGLPFLLISIGSNNLVRADGSPKYSMFSIVTGAVLNTILDPIFIFWFKWGIAGAAWATVISQILAAGILLAYYPRFKTVTFKAKDFIPKPKIMINIVKLGLSPFVYQFSATIIQITTNKMLAKYGAMSIYGSDIPIAVAGITFKVYIIFVSIVMGMVQGAQPINGYNYGARNYLRVRESIFLLIKIVLGISAVAFLVFELFPKQIVSLFGNGSKEYFSFAVKYMRIYMALLIPNGIGIACGTFFPQIGNAKKGTQNSILKQIVFLLPLIIILPRFMGVFGVAYATPLTDVLSTIVVVYLMVDELKKIPKENYSHIPEVKGSTE